MSNVETFEHAGYRVKISRVDMSQDKFDPRVFSIAQWSGLRPEKADKVVFGKNDDKGAWHFQVRGGPLDGMFAVYSPDHSFGPRCVPALADAKTEEEALNAIYDNE